MVDSVQWGDYVLGARYLLIGETYMPRKVRWNVSSISVSFSRGVAAINSRGRGRRCMIGSQLQQVDGRQRQAVLVSLNAMIGAVLQ